MPLTSNTLARVVAVVVIAISALACTLPVDRCPFMSNNLCAKVTATEFERLGSLRVQGESR